MQHCTCFIQPRFINAKGGPPMRVDSQWTDSPGRVSLLDTPLPA
jgi:hypothetical protein